MPTLQYDATGTLTGLLLDDGQTIVPCAMGNPAYDAYVIANGIPKQHLRTPLNYTQTYAQIQVLYGSNQTLALKYLCAWVAFIAVNNPGPAAQINQALGTSIAFDQPAP